MLRPAALALSLGMGALHGQTTVPASRPATYDPVLEPAMIEAGRALVAKHGDSIRPRVVAGLRQMAAFWRKEDGDAAAFQAFVAQHFAADEPARDALFQRLEFVLESLDGHLAEISRDFRWNSDLETGPAAPVDDLLGGFDPTAHVASDFFANKLAFAVLLNFPMTTLEERTEKGASWTRRQWAEARLVDRFTTRVPAEANQAVAAGLADAERYVAGLNFWMHHILDAEGRRLFRPGQRLLSHWNLRDEIKSQYAQEGGQFRQRVVQKLMEAIVASEVPAQLIDNPLVDWNPWKPTELVPSPVKDSDRTLPASYAAHNTPEPDTRYAKILVHFKAQRRVDDHSPAAPTVFARRFDQDRQLSEAKVKALLESVCNSPLVAAVGKTIETRLKRKLEPFDLWYNGFRPGSTLDEAELDAKTRARYPNAAAFQKDLPTILEKIGFSREKAAWLAERIEVDPARGSGHAMGAQRRGDKARLRTRIGKDGMDYKGFNIAIHELGHNVEQTFSLYGIDHWLLNGVPNNAFTEAMAFTFQAKDLQVLGFPPPDAAAKAESTLGTFWQTLEIAGVGLLDMAVWRWLYAHPDATPAQLKAAVLAEAKALWNRYYAPVFGQKDCTLLAVYSHMLNYPLYLPDYPLGHLVAFQVDQHLERTSDVGPEIERLCRLGRLTPDAWMKQATGQTLSAQPLLEATAKALGSLAGKDGRP